MGEKTKVQLDVYGKRGFRATFPYSVEAVKTIKRCLGFRWDKKMIAWLSAGPEVLLDLARFKVDFYPTLAAKKRADAFYHNLAAVLACKDQVPAVDEPYAFQVTGADVLVLQCRGILADEMGLGKSKQALEACVRLGCRTVLILAPKSLLWNWVDEVDRWAPGTTREVLPDDKAKRTAFWDRYDAGIVVANYEKVLAIDWPDGTGWDAVILDEVTRAKNTRTGIHKRLRQVAERASHVFALTGTPLELRVEELYGIVSLVRPAVFGGFPRFRDQHLVTNYFGQVVGSRQHQLLKERIGPWLLRRTKAEVAPQLPPKVYNTVWVELAGPEREGYDEIRRDYLTWLKEQDRDASEANALTQLLRLQQYTSSPSLVVKEEEKGYVHADISRGSKFLELESLLKEWPGRAMVFTRFVSAARLLVRELGLPRDALIEGEVGAEDRLRRVKAFNAGELGDVFVSTDAGAYGLNVTGADLVVQYDLLWNPAKLWQREDRLHRIGQARTVNVVYLLARGTIDQGMFDVLRRRQELFHDLMDGTEEAVPLRLTARQLRLVAEGKL